MGIAVAISLFFHGIGFSLFSVALPAKRKTFKKMEVYLVKRLPPEEMETEGKKRLSPQIPRIREEKRDVKIYLPEEKLIPRYIKFPQRNWEISSSEISLGKIINLKIEMPFPKPEIREGLLSGKGKASLIYGPGGSRRLLFQPLPKYPEWAEKEGIECSLELKLWILPSGNVESVEVIKSSGYPEIDLLCQNVVKTWLFEEVHPVGAKGKGKVWGILPLKFLLK